MFVRGTAGQVVGGTHLDSGEYTAVAVDFFLHNITRVMGFFL